MNLSTRRPLARKQHVCDTCGTSVLPGERYVRQAGVGDDGFYTWKACQPCDDLVNIVWEWADRPYEGVGEDDYIEWAHEPHDESQSVLAKAFLARKKVAHDAWIARLDAAHGEQA